MPATRILWGQVLVVLAIVVSTTWGATEWVAWRLAFQPELGAPLGPVDGLSSLSTARLLLVVVRVRRLRAEDLLRRAPTSPRRAGSSRSPSPSPCRCGAPAKHATSRPSAPHAGRVRAKSATPDWLATTAWSSAGSRGIICATTDPSMSCASRPHARARASDWSCRRC